jgi:hypothetical protein
MTYPVPIITKFPGVIDCALELVTSTKLGVSFDENGLAYSFAETEDALKKFIDGGDIEDLAEHADVVSHAFPDWCGSSFLELQTFCTSLKGCNSTAWANTAYIATYATVPEFRKVAMNLLEKSMRNSV